MRITDVTVSMPRPVIVPVINNGDREAMKQEILKTIQAHIVFRFGAEYDQWDTVRDLLSYNLNQQEAQNDKG